MVIQCPKGFTLMTGAWRLDEPVYDPITCSDESVVVNINRAFERIGCFVRLYQHLIWVYKKTINRDPVFNERVYHIENRRREIQGKINKCESEGWIGIELRFRLLAEVNTVTYAASKIFEIYDRDRQSCLSREDEPRPELLKKLKDVLYAEQRVFNGYPETREVYGRTGEQFWLAAFGNKEPSPEEQKEIDQFRRHYLSLSDSTTTST